MEKEIEVSYFLDFLNNDFMLWSIRLILILGIISLLGYYYSCHKKYKEEHNKEEGEK